MSSQGLIRAPRRPPGWEPPGPIPPGDRGDPTLLPSADEDLCFLSGHWRLFQKRHGHRWSLDDLVTGWVAARHAPNDGNALDLGCGLGSVLLLVAWRCPTLAMTGVEAQADRAAMARRSARYDGVEQRCRVVDGDLRDPATLATGERFALITGTPPYFPDGAGTQSEKPHAAPCRFEHRGGVEAYLEAATRWLTDDGVFVMCAAALERDRVTAAGRAQGLGCVEHWEIIPREGKAALITVDVFRRGAATTTAHALTVRTRSGQWTDEFRTVRRDMGLPPSAPRERAD